MRPILALCLCLLASPRSLASPEEAPRVDLETLVVEAPVAPTSRTPKEDIRRLLRPEASILEARNRLDRDLQRRQQELEVKTDLMSRVKADLEVNTRRFADMTAALETERVLVKTRLAALGRVERTRALADLLSTSASPTPSWSTFEKQRNAEAVLDLADRERIRRYAAHLASWRERKQDLERRSLNLERLSLSLRYLEQELAWDREEREALQTAVVEEPEFYATYAREIETLDETLAAKVRDLLTKVPADRGRLYIEETRGGLAWPIRNSDVVGGFGTRNYKGIRSVWRGAHLVPLRPPASGKTEVRSIYWGYVLWTGWMQGLGQVVMVDHTLGYVSLYAHLASIEVEVGTKVASGDILGLMGDTESYFGPRLYLELRKDGVAIEPIGWLK